MTTRYFAEEPCEHGWVGIHWLSPDDDRTAADHSRPPCPGGQRRELTGVEERSLWSWSESGKRRQMEPGRYLVIPLEEPAT